MGKNKKSKKIFFDEFLNSNIEIDSQEEYQFYNWIIEAKKMNIILDYIYQPNSFLLTEKTLYTPLFNNPKNKEKHLFAEHIYTADFKIIIDYKYGEIFSKYFKLSKNNLNADGNIEIYIDVKGGFMSNDSGRSFSINQKLVYEKYKILISKLVPKDFFLKLGCPKNLFFTEKTHKKSKVFENFPTIESVFNAR